MAVSITRRQIDEGRDVAPTPVKKTVPITTTPIIGAAAGRATTGTKSGGAATTPVNTGATISPVGSGTVATATRTSQTTTVVTGSSPAKQTGIGSGVQPGTVMSVGFGAEAAVYNVSPNDISAKNVLYANTRANNEDVKEAQKQTKNWNYGVLSGSKSAGGKKVIESTYQARNTIPNSIWKASTFSGTLDCDMLTHIYSFGNVESFAQQNGYSTEDAIMVIAASWQHCRQELQQSFVGTSPGVADRRIDNAEAYLRQFVDDSGYSDYLSQYNSIIDSRLSYYGTRMVDPVVEAPVDVMGFVIGVRLDYSGTLGIGGDFNIEIQIMPWHLQPQYFNQRHAVNVAFNPSLEASSSPGVNAHFGPIIGLMESTQFATSGGLAEQYGIGISLPWGGGSGEADILTPIGGKGGLLYVGGGGQAGPPGVYVATGTTISIFDILKALGIGES